MNGKTPVFMPGLFDWVDQPDRAELKEADKNGHDRVLAQRAGFNPR
jgi:hypothetical protein